MAQTPSWQPVRGASIKIERHSSGTLADFTGDGHLDFRARPREGTDLRLLPGDGKGGFGPIAQVMRLRYEPGGTLVTDVNGDDRPDIVSNSFGGNALGVLLGG